jgi:phage gp36-like protein
VAAYCTKGDLVERFGIVELAQLTDDTAHATPDDAEIVKACDEASSVIDSYLATRYTTPLIEVPTLVRMLACNIARKLLWKDRALPDSVVQRNYDEAITQLRDLAKGVSSLSGILGVIVPLTGSSIAVVSSPQVFTDDVLGLMP